MKSSSVLILIFNHFATASFIVLLWIIPLTIFLKTLYYDHPAYSTFLTDLFAIRFFVGIVFYLIISLILYLIIYNESLQDKKIKETQLSSLLKETQLQLLKSQVNPHFLFNCLNSVNALITVSPEKAQNMILKLSYFLRYAIEERENETVELKDEIENVKNYLEIEQIRFSSKLNFEIKIPDNCLVVKVPDLILQPIVENVIKHAVYESLTKIEMTIESFIENNECILIVRNTIAEDSVAKKRSGLGLKLVKQRLHTKYGNGNWVTIRKKSDLFEVQLKIPVCPK